MKLDSIDKTLLSTLQKYGRITNVDLAERVGISAPPCLRRLKLMESNGVIKGYHAEVNAKVLDFNLQALCIITLNSQDSKDVNNFLANIEKCKNIRSCTSTAGNENFILSIVAKDMHEYESILKKEIQSGGLVNSIKTYIKINKHKDEPGFPIL